MYLTWKCLLFLSCILTTWSKHFLIETVDNVSTSNPNPNSIEESEEYEYEYDENYDDYSYAYSYDDYDDLYDYDYDDDPNAIESKVFILNVRSCHQLCSFHFLPF